MQTSELEIELGKRGLTLCDADCGRVARRGYAYCAPCDERLAKPARYPDKYRFTVVAAEIPQRGRVAMIRFTNHANHYSDWIPQSRLAAFVGLDYPVNGTAPRT